MCVFRSTGPQTPFSKNARDNIEDDEEQELKRQAKIAFTLSNEQLLKLLENGTYQEVKSHDKSQDI